MGKHATGNWALVGGMWLTVCVLHIPVACKGSLFLIIWRKLDIEVRSSCNGRFGKHREPSNRIE